MKNLVPFSLMIMLLILPQSCEEASIQKEMVRFDQAFIPVLFYLYQEKAVLAERALYRLESQWDHFHQNYQDKMEGVEDWQEAFRKADAWLDDARYSIRKTDLSNALVQMDHMRYELTEIRRIRKMPYFLDAVWGLEEVLMKMTAIAKDPMLDLIDFEEFECLVHEMDHRWNQVLNTPMDIRLHDLYPDKLGAYQNRQWQMTTSVAYFKEAVECGDGDQFAFQANLLEQSYLDYLAVFGNFKAPADHFFAGPNREDLPAELPANKQVVQ